VRPTPRATAPASFGVTAGSGTYRLVDGERARAGDRSPGIDDALASERRRFGRRQGKGKFRRRFRRRKIPAAERDPIMTSTNQPAAPAKSAAQNRKPDDHDPAPSKAEPAPPASGDDKPVDPVGDAGVFDIDPDQDDVNQDSETAVTGDIDSFPVDEEP
jgi:hypothetical protein